MRISDWSSDVCSSDLETRAWTIVRGTKAPQAAGVIHTDFERGFIRAFTIGYDDYIQFKGEDRKSVVEGKSVSVRVDLGGRRSIKKKNKKNKDVNTYEKSTEREKTKRKKTSQRK